MRRVVIVVVVVAVIAAGAAVVQTVRLAEARSVASEQQARADRAAADADRAAGEAERATAAAAAARDELEGVEAELAAQSVTVLACRDAVDRGVETTQALADVLGAVGDLDPVDAEAARDRLPQVVSGFLTSGAECGGVPIDEFAPGLPADAVAADGTLDEDVVAAALGVSQPAPAEADDPGEAESAEQASPGSVGAEEEPFDVQCADETWRADEADCPAAAAPDDPPPRCPTWQPGDGLGCEPNPGDGEGGVPGAIDTAPGYDPDDQGDIPPDMVCPGPGCAVGG